MRVMKPHILPEDLGSNPFVKKLVIPVTKRLDYGKTVKEPNGTYGTPTVNYEYTSYTKLFCSPERRFETNKLSPRSKELLLWIMYQIPNAQEFIWINKKMYMEESNITSIDTYKKCIKELVINDFLTPTIKLDVYWINPDKFFKGNRLEKYPDNCVIKYNYSEDKT